jgi:hypothetical protein
VGAFAGLALIVGVVGILCLRKKQREANKAAEETKEKENAAAQLRLKAAANTAKAEKDAHDIKLQRDKLVADYAALQAELTAREHMLRDLQRSNDVGAISHKWLAQKLADIEKDRKRLQEQLAENKKPVVDSAPFRPYLRYLATLPLSTSSTSHDDELKRSRTSYVNGALDSPLGLPEFGMYSSASSEESEAESDSSAADAAPGDIELAKVDRQKPFQPQ